MTMLLPHNANPELDPTGTPPAQKCSAVPNSLDAITGPADLKRLDPDDLAELAAEIRQFLIQSVSATGGHLGSNLGVVEISIAVHRVFESPRDVILWDTGHQAYVHKILTGRKASFDQLRRAGGLSGYPCQAESEHDVIENSHASTALSYADGLAKAFSLRGDQDRAVVAVVGDGALTGGMCWEAMNNIGGSPQRPIVIVLNDNGRSYAPTIGGLAGHLARLRGRDASDASDAHGEPSAVFAEFGLGYVGPVDGHNTAAVETALRTAHAMGKPVVVHCVTRKGMGHPAAEQHEADCMHAIGPVAASGTTQPPMAAARTWTDVFGIEIANIASERPDLVAISAAMLRPVGLQRFAETYPERVFDVGIAEQHAVTSAAGLALGGMHPVVAIYATFLNRAFDQALMDIALHRLGVTFVLDRAGITGDDGPSHNGMWDLSLLQLLPGVRIAAPRDAATLRAELQEAVQIDDGPTVVRFPKSAVEPDLPGIDTIGGIDVLSRRRGSSVLVVSVGAMASTCMAMADELADRGIAATVVDPRWVYPVAPALVELAARHRLVVTVEDGNIVGGIGTAIAQALRHHGVDTPAHEFGIPPRFHQTAKRAALLSAFGLNAVTLADRVSSELSSEQDHRLRLPITRAGRDGLRGQVRDRT
jgi:1-deoxy-D-xylulose-5-phosphate synthase